MHSVGRAWTASTRLQSWHFGGLDGIIYYSFVVSAPHDCLGTVCVLLCFFYYGLR